MQRIGHLDDHRIDHREIRRHRHAVVEESRVLDHAAVVEDVLLVERPSDPLGRAALHLALDIARVDGLSSVLNGRVAEHRDLAGFGIDLDVTQVRREAGAGHGRVEGGLRDDRSAGSAHLRRDLGERQRLGLVCGAAVAGSRGGNSAAVLPCDAVELDAPDLRGAFAQL